MGCLWPSSGKKILSQFGPRVLKIRKYVSTLSEGIKVEKFKVAFERKCEDYLLMLQRKMDRFRKPEIKIHLLVN